ncbi:MAG: (Fe-S)-binding protein, partial [Deltaproteobacteria bacterium]|nr:(Fe-S)-binding protein [Deltaproteobacteria bacterium]
MANQDYQIMQLLEMGACTNCQVCADVCPAVSVTEDGELSAIYRMKGLNRILRSRSWPFRRLFRNRGVTKEDLDRYSETVFRCTLCGNCQEVCTVGIHLKDLWLTLRQDLVHSNAYP